MRGHFGGGLFLKDFFFELFSFKNSKDGVQINNDVMCMHVEFHD